MRMSKNPINIKVLRLLYLSAFNITRMFIRASALRVSANVAIGHQFFYFKNM